MFRWYHRLRNDNLVFLVTYSTCSLSWPFVRFVLLNLLFSVQLFVVIVCSFVLFMLTIILPYIKSRSLSSCKSIKTVFFFIHYTFISDSKLIRPIKNIYKKRMIKVSCHQEGQMLFCKNTTLILQKGPWNWHHQNIWVFGWQHILMLVDVYVGISVDTNCVLLLENVFPYSYEACFMQRLLKTTIESYLVF